MYIAVSNQLCVQGKYNSILVQGSYWSLGCGQ